MSAMLKATFRCMKHLWVHPNSKSGIKTSIKDIYSQQVCCIADHGHVFILAYLV